jgi:quercetin dioxygenase-like cupin family protein
MARCKVLPAAESRTASFPWGSLTWFASAELGNAEGLTVGRCVIRPGQANPRHRHPNCEEVLHVLAGRIAHELGDGAEAEMGPGDTVTAPAGVPHRARNVGDVDAVLMVSFSTGKREVVGE